MAKTSSSLVPQMGAYRAFSRSVEGVKSVIEDETEYPVLRALGWSDWALGENEYANKQKNKILEMIKGKDYKNPKKSEEDKKREAIGG